MRTVINKVESYVKMDLLPDPVVEIVADLEPAALFDQKLSEGSEEMIFSIAPSFPKGSGHVKSRVVFRTGTFQANTVDNVVVLRLVDFNNWFYILHFSNQTQAEKFMKILLEFESSENVMLDMPIDLRSYIVSESSNEDLLHSQNELGLGFDF